RGGVGATRVAWPGDLSAGPALDRYHELDGRLEKIADWLDPDGDAVAASARPNELAGLARRASALRADLSLLVGGRGREHVRWLAASARHVGLHASPVDVSAMLGRALDACPGPVVLTSATLTVGGAVRLPARARRAARHGVGCQLRIAVSLRPPGAALRRARSPRTEPRRFPEAGRGADGGSVRGDRGTRPLAVHELP